MAFRPGLPHALPGFRIKPSIALRIDVHVCPHLLFIFAFPTIENDHLKSLESQFWLVCLSAFWFHLK